jgi:nicotinamide mononucleotide transporter
LFILKDFNSFFSGNGKRSLLKWVNNFNDGLSLWRRIFLCLSGASAFTNVLNVVLVIHGKMSSFFWGILGAILYGTYAFAYGYAGDAQLSVFFFLPMQFFGIYIWSKELDNQSTTRVKSLKLSGWFFTLLLSLILVILFYYEIPLFSKLLTQSYLFESRFVPHVLDAITNGLSVIGQFLVITCYWEQYIIWTFVNIMLIVMYSGK